MVIRVGFTASKLDKEFSSNDCNKKVYEYLKNIPSQFKNIRILSSLVYNLYEFGQKYPF